MRKFVTYGIIIFQLILVGSLVKSIQMSLRARNRLTDLEAKKAKLAEEQQKLKEELKYVESEFYVEKVAREELQLSKPGETVVMIPPEAKKVDESKSSEKIQEEANYLKWWRVISGNNQ